MTPNEILKQYFGCDEFREGQEELINALVSGKDAFGIMPTGAGKSLCYQVPAMLLPMRNAKSPFLVLQTKTVDKTVRR